MRWSLLQLPWFLFYVEHLNMLPSSLDIISVVPPCTGGRVMNLYWYVSLVGWFFSWIYLITILVFLLFGFSQSYSRIAQLSDMTLNAFRYMNLKMWYSQLAFQRTVGMWVSPVILELIRIILQLWFNKMMLSCYYPYLILSVLPFVTSYLGGRFFRDSLKHLCHSFPLINISIVVVVFTWFSFYCSLDGRLVCAFRFLISKLPHLSLS